MNTKLLMISSAVVLAIVGLAATFLPQEILQYAGASGSGLDVVIVQLAGAAFLGFAMLNWMARANVIGGIYSRPIALGNFLHFTVAGLAMVKAALGGARSVEIVIGAVVYVVFAAAFGVLLFTHPGRARGAES